MLHKSSVQPSLLGADVLARPTASSSASFHVVNGDRQRPLPTAFLKQPVNSSDLIILAYSTVWDIFWWPRGPTITQAFWSRHRFAFTKSLACSVAAGSAASETSSATCPHHQRSLPSCSVWCVCQAGCVGPVCCVWGHLPGDAHRIGASNSASGHLAH